jgi:hypothetical protein
MTLRVPQSNPVVEAMWKRLDRDFAEQLAGTTPPRAPEPMPVPPMPVPEFPAKDGGREL